MTVVTQGLRSRCRAGMGPPNATLFERLTNVRHSSFAGIGAQAAQGRRRQPQRLCSTSCSRGKPTFWITNEREPTSHNIHVAFAAPDRATVDAFHGAALEAGGTDNGGPGIRQIYHPGYYGAFVLDPDANNVEAVCHRPE